MIGTEGLVGVSALFGAEVSSQNVISRLCNILRMNSSLPGGIQLECRGPQGDTAVAR